MGSPINVLHLLAIALVGSVVLALACFMPVLGIMGALLLGGSLLISLFTPKHSAVAVTAVKRKLAMPELPAHVADMQEDLHPLLTRLYRALHGTPREEPVANDVATLLAEYRIATKVLFDTCYRLKREVFDQRSCTEEHRQSAGENLTLALDASLRCHHQIGAARLAYPCDVLLLRLEHNQRANLERLAMWLADIQLTLQDPGRIVRQGSDSVEYKLSFSFPNSVAELASFADLPTGYDSGHVSAALEGARKQRRRAQTLDPAPSPPVASVTPRPAGCDWFTPLVLGWLIGDWLSNNDSKREK